MRFAVTLIMLLLFSFVAADKLNAQSYTQGKIGPFKNINVKLRFHATPLYEVFNHSNSTDTNFRGWLLIEVSYLVPKIKTGNASLWVDDITMEVELIMPARFKGRKVVAILTGKVPYWSIPMDGKKHLAMACVPPRVIARYAREGNKMKEKNLLARVSFYTKSRRLLGRAYSSSGSMSPSQAGRYFDKYGGPVSSGALKLEGLIVPRNKTPWAFVNYDYYDMIRPDRK
ncbi:hypothetical protein P0136_02475 [Lentisphaerota bacterium ZTH]|nr:hypothetical protein JYG24_06385 [Lentisphaerota bacterium]WET06867.1 hypothetical protein P0136_02475 [Lentisphaerota bacterium ZTH]